jgi:hypothetical protein
MGLQNQSFGFKTLVEISAKNHARDDEIAQLD